jgi:hypothetical protein
MSDKILSNYLEIEINKLYLEVNKLCKNSSPSFLAIRKVCEYPFYMFCLLLSRANPQASQQLNYRSIKYAIF